MQNGQNKRISLFKRYCCTTALVSDNTMRLMDESRSLALKTICKILYVQKGILAINLLLMQEGRRQNYPEVEEAYPLTQEGD